MVQIQHRIGDAVAIVVAHAEVRPGRRPDAPPERLLHERAAGRLEHDERGRRGGIPVEHDRVVPAVTGHVAGGELRLGPGHATGGRGPARGLGEGAALREEPIQARAAATEVVQDDHVVAAVPVHVGDRELGVGPVVGALARGPGGALRAARAVGEEHVEARRLVAQVEEGDAVGEPVAVDVARHELGLRGVEGAGVALPDDLLCEGAALGDERVDPRGLAAEVVEPHGVEPAGGVLHGLHGRVRWLGRDGPHGAQHDEQRERCDDDDADCGALGAGLRGERRGGASHDRPPPGSRSGRRPFHLSRVHRSPREQQALAFGRAGEAPLRGVHRGTSRPRSSVASAPTAGSRQWCSRRAPSR